MDPVKTFNNSGGRTLIGNYVEEQHAGEKFGTTTNFNTDLNTSMMLRHGNVGAVQPQESTPENLKSTTRVDFAGEDQSSTIDAEAMKTNVLNRYMNAINQSSSSCF
eukprot:m.269990 g.269990  ORF g.269990 m.269990 type:complete len:106 (-) comp87755_c0_seq1:51-368(-)